MTCILCGANESMMLARHHKVFRSHGGTNDPSNLAILCKVCHDAVHGIKATLHGHSCQTCPVLRTGCHFGERVLGRPIVTAHPWEESTDVRVDPEAVP